jgi:hypothetical protein
VDANALLLERDFSGACQTTALVRAGRFGADFRSIGRRKPQCDAVHFLEQVMAIVAEKEADMMEALGVNQLDEDVMRTPAREYVWGCLGRSRLFCNACGIASDTLFTHNVIKLDVSTTGADTLQSLLTRHLSQHSAAAEDRCPDHCGTTGRLWKQFFIERAASVVFPTQTWDGGAHCR